MSNINIELVSPLENAAKKYNAELYFGECMAPYTSFKVGGTCTALININCDDLLIEVIDICNRVGAFWYILGKGSNVLIGDNGVKGVIIHLDKSYSDVTINGNIITAKAGASLTGLATKAAENQLSGLEFAYGIPGSVGGAVYMNAGAYGGEIKDIITSCRYLDENLKIKTVSRKEMQLSYRQSMFTKTKKVILEAEFALEKVENKEIITEKMNDFMSRRKEKQPLEYPSAGSTFKRPEGDYAARLIDECGLKGVSVGGATVSEKHSGFIINKNNATALDILSLIELVKEKVYIQTGIELECEVEILN